MCDLNDEDFHAIVNAIIQTHSDRHTSVYDHSTPDRRQTSRLTSLWNELIKYVKPVSLGLASDTDRRQTSRIKPASSVPASHIEELDLSDNKFSDVETVRLLLDNLPSSLRNLFLSGNQFNKEIQKIERTCEDKHPNLYLGI